MILISVLVPHQYLLYKQNLETEMTSTDVVSGPTQSAILTLATHFWFKI